MHEDPCRRPRQATGVGVLVLLPVQASYNCHRPREDKRKKAKEGRKGGKGGKERGREGKVARRGTRWASAPAGSGRPPRRASCTCSSGLASPTAAPDPGALGSTRSGPRGTCGGRREGRREG